MEFFKDSGSFKTSSCSSQISLHSAIHNQNLKLAEDLIKQGADVNATDPRIMNLTALHIAVVKGDVEAVCMLLYYGADVSIVSVIGQRPLDYALLKGFHNLTEILVDYHDVDDVFNTIALRVADTYLGVINEAVEYRIRVSAKNFGSTNIVKDILNWTPIFRVLFEREPFHLFQILLPKITTDIFDNLREPLLYTFFQSCNYKCTEFLECCHLMLDNSNVPNIVEQFNASACFVWHLLAFIDNGKYRISRSDRLGLIYILLSQGIQITLQDIVYVFNNNGYNQEIMAFIYGAHINRSAYHYEKYCVLPLTSFIFALEENSSRKIVFKMFRNLAYRSFNIRPENIKRFLYFLRFFSFPAVVKEKLIRLCEIHINYNEEIIAKIKQVQIVPSLVEVGRNKTRDLIKRKYKIKESYQFHDIVKRLDVPQCIKNILIYRTPIYE